MAGSSRGGLVSAQPIDPWHIITSINPPKPATPPRPTTHSSTGSGYAHTALTAEAQRVTDSTPGERNDTLNRAAFNLGQLIAGGALNQQDVTDALTTAAWAVGLDNDEIAGTIKSGLTAGAEHPRGVPEGHTDTRHDTPPPPGIDPETGEIITPTQPGLTVEQYAERAHQRAVTNELAQLRARDEAKRLFTAERAAAQFREPPSTRTLADELLIPDLPVTYAIADLLPTGANALLAAQYKTGKTTFINNYARIS